MIPSTANVLDLTDAYLRETATAGWRGKHPVQTLHDPHIERGRGVTIKPTKRSKGHRILAPVFSPAATLADVMRKAVTTIAPKLRKTRLARAEGYSCDEIAKRLKMSRNKASNMVRTSLAVGKMFLLVR